MVQRKFKLTYTGGKTGVEEIEKQTILFSNLMITSKYFDTYYQGWFS